MSAFTSQDLIQLPRLTAVEAASLISEALVIAESRGPLPDHIERSRKRLEGAQRALVNALQAGEAAPESTPAARRRAERAIDAAWEATYDWLSGWCKLEGDALAHRARARALFTLVFGESIAMAQMPYKIDWPEARRRVEAIEQEGHDQTFAALGGSAFLTELRRTLAAPDVARSGTAEAAAELAVAASALRQYVGRVMSYADDDVEGSEDLTEALLRPLSRWHLMHPWRAPEQDYGPVEVTRY